MKLQHNQYCGALWALATPRIVSILIFLLSWQIGTIYGSILVLRSMLPEEFL